MTRPESLRRDWPTIAACALGTGTGMTGLPFYLVGLLIVPVSAEFGWSRALVASAGLCLQIGVAATAPLAGRLVDRFGTPAVAIPSLVLMAPSLLLLARFGSDPMLYFGGWLLLALAGGGTTPVSWTRAIAGRFRKRRGLALGLTLSGTGVAGMLAPLVLAPLIAAHGWRTALETAAGFIIVVAAPATWFLFRVAPRRASEDNNGDADPSGVPLSNAVRSRPFALLAITFALFGLAITSLVVHLVPILTQQLGQAAAARWAAVVGVALIFGRIAAGLCVDRFRPPLVATALLILPAAAALLLRAGILAPAVILLGLSAGAEIDLLAFLAGWSFGPRDYGAIYGRLLALFSLAAGIGPILTGVLYDRFAGYDEALVLWAAVIAIAALLIAQLRPMPAEAWSAPSSGADPQKRSDLCN